MKIKPSKKFEKAIRSVRAQREPRVATALFEAGRKLPVVRFKKLLAPVDFSMFSIAGVRYAVSLADKLGATVSLIHVVEPAPIFGGEESLILARSDAEVMELAERHSNRLAQRLSKKGLIVRPFVRRGKPFNEISALADADHADLIVLATHGRTGLKRVLLGSTAERVVRHGPCPVLTVPSQSGRRSGARALRIKRIVVPIDFSETSVQALPYAAALAHKFGAEIVLVHIIEAFPVPAEMGSVPLKLRTEDKNAAQERLLQLSREVLPRDLATRTFVKHGQPFREITAMAASLGADMIALTTHGYTGLTHVLLGSTAELVVRYADCPVLVVRELKGSGKRKRRSRNS